MLHFKVHCKYSDTVEKFDDGCSQPLMENVQSVLCNYHFHLEFTAVNFHSAVTLPRNEDIMFLCCLHHILLTLRTVVCRLYMMYTKLKFSGMAGQI